MSASNHAGAPPSKLSKLKAAYYAGDQIGALRIAAKFPQLGKQKDAIERAWAAYQNPGFYKQLGKDPDELIGIGMAALRERYAL